VFVSEETPRERMERAVRAVRREGQKAALIEATVEAVAVLLVVDLLLSVVPVAQLPPTVPVPESVAPSPAFAALDTGAVVAVVVGVVTFGAGLWLRLRRPAVERFGAVNPAVSEALRTARDAVESDADGRMATRLYEDTVAALRETSSLGLLHVRRIAVVLVLIAVLAPASIGATATGFEVTLDGGEDGSPASQGPSDEFEGLQDPDSVLGDPEDVEAGDEAVNATVGSQGGGGNESQAAAPGAYSGFGQSGDVETEGQQAGFAEQERLEDAELIREYNLRIRQEEDDTQ
jgi:hypothetical protein